MAEETVTIAYEKYKAMEFEIRAIRNKGCYVVRDLLNKSIDYAQFYLGGITIDDVKIIKEANYRISQHYENEQNIQYLKSELNKQQLKINNLEKERDQLLKKVKNRLW